MSVRVALRPSVCLYYLVCLSVAVCLSVSLVCPAVCPSLCLYMYVSYLSFRTSSTHLAVDPFFLSVYLFRPSVCLYIRVSM